MPQGQSMEFFMLFGTYQHFTVLLARCILPSFLKKGHVFCILVYISGVVDSLHAMYLEERSK